MRHRWFLFRRWSRRLFLGALTVMAAYALVLAYPQPLFAYKLEHAGIVVHARRPIPDAMKGTLARARARLNRSPIYDQTRVSHVFICEPRWVFALFARNHYNVGGIANAFVGRHVFLRESDMESDRLISPSGQLVASNRPLSYFIAHELMHIANARFLGRRGYFRLAQWADDGYADYVARDIDLSVALRDFKAGARELDPSRSGLYIRYQLLVAYLLDKRGLDARTLLQQPIDQETIEREIGLLSEW